MSTWKQNKFKKKQIGNLFYFIFLNLETIRESEKLFEEHVEEEEKRVCKERSRCWFFLVPFYYAL